jgi:NADPH:quinone reductase-like Zn-dependent oxidoreductase
MRDGAIRVFGNLFEGPIPRGATSERKVVAERLLALAPASISLLEAAAVPAAAMTAFQLIQNLKVGSGDTVLIHAVAGGVGQFAAQLALRAGATVIGTASPRNHEYLHSLGVIPVAYGDGLGKRRVARL